jgi:hypothetical protein
VSARTSAITLAVALGFYAAYSVLALPSSHLTGPTFLMVWGLAALTIIVSLVLRVFDRTKATARIGFLSAALLLATFYAAYGVGRAFGWQDWSGDRVVPLG